MLFHVKFLLQEHILSERYPPAGIAECFNQHWELSYEFAGRKPRIVSGKGACPDDGHTAVAAAIAYEVLPTHCGSREL